ETLTVACAPTAPASGDPCDFAGQVCVFESDLSGPCPDSASGATSVWHCEIDGWSDVAACNDQSACPAAMPRDGEACGGIIEGAECFYSTAGCETGGVAQCSGGVFRATNDCGVRTLEGCEMARSGEYLFLSTGTYTDPVLSLIGAQALVGGYVDDGTTDALTLQLDVLQTQAANATLTNTFSSGMQQGAVVAITAMRDRWWLVDPVVFGAATSNDLGTLSLQAKSGGATTVPVAGVPTGLAIAPSGGWAALRGASSLPGTLRATLLPIDATGAPVGIGEVVADQAKPGAPLVPPVAQALATVARTTKGFVVAYTVPASGELLDDSGVEIVFIDDPTARALPAEAGNAFRVGAGAVGQIAIAPMRDGTVVLATTPLLSTSTFTTLPSSIALTRVARDGTKSTLTPQTVSEPKAEFIGIGSGVSLAPLDDGFVVAYQTLGVDPFTGATSSDVFVVPYASTGIPTPTTGGVTYDYARLLKTDSPIVLATAQIDQSVHFLFVDDSNGPPNELIQGRLYCKR
ncbi:MAG: hypothetical protein ACHREM_24910, partial [Polyangiales bacterium]